MDGQQYLQQISEMNRPAPPASTKNKILSILTSKFFIIGAIGLVLLIIILIIGSILSSDKGGVKTLGYELKSHLNSTTEVIQEYQQYVKSSNLRSNSASLYGVLSNTNNELTSYLENKYGSEEEKITESIEEQAALAKDNLMNELFEAKISGILDRIYAHKMAYEISLLATEETQLIEISPDDELIALLNKSYEGLNNLYDKFNDFSETNN